jgi:DNA-binding transcriptional MocR family regulator
MAEDLPINWTRAYAGRTDSMRASEIRELLKLLAQPDIISFAGGIPDPALFPSETVGKAYSTILADPQLGPQSLQYSTSEGYLPLRHWIVAHMTRLGVPCDADNIAVTSGSQQGLDFLGKLFLSAGDTALVTAPTYLGAVQAFNAYEPRYDILTLDECHTSSAAYLDSAKAAGGRVALAYVVPDFANPTGETLSERARHHLLDLVAELGVPLIEDAAYEALRFEGRPVPSCLALDLQRRGHIDSTQVIYCGTFSKTIAPGLRVGWICAARDLVHKVVLVKQAADLHSATLNQMVMQRVAQAVYDDQVGKIVVAYSKRRDAMLAVLARHMPEGVTWTRPQGGMFVWVTLPMEIDGAHLLEEALREERVAFVPGGAFFVDGQGANTIRLNYSLQSEAAIGEGIQRLGRLVVRQLAQKRPRPSTPSSPRAA